MARRTVKLPSKTVWNERAYRDQLNGILRDENGKMTHIHGKPIIKKEEK